MSLVSTKNLLAPFTNKVHLVTMLLVIIAFTVLRLSGGGFFMEKRDSSVPREVKRTKYSNTLDTRTAKPRAEAATDSDNKKLADIESEFEF